MSRATACRPLARSELLELHAAGQLHVSTEVAARVLGIGENRLRQLADAGELPVPFFRMGRTIRVQLAGLLELLGISA